MKRKTLLTALAGTFIEYYDYALYGFTASLIAVHFFPEDDPTVSLIQTFGIFALGSCAKPLGALIFGSLGDSRGRRFSLRLSMLGIALPTMVIGLLPDYKTWGWVSPFILLLCRIIQGMFVAGEYDGVMIYMLEHIAKKRACFGSSLVGLVSIVGIGLASLAATFVQHQNFQQEHLSDILWRLPFLGGGILGIFVFFFRQYLDETPEFKAYQAKPSLAINISFIKFLKRNRREIFCTILVCGAVGGCYHFYIIFWATYLSKILQVISLDQASFATSVNVFTLAFFLPIAGFIADRVGAKKTLTIAALGLIIMGIVNGLAVTYSIMPLGVMMMTATVMAFFMVPGHAYLINLYSVSERYRGLSLGHTLGSMLFSGSAPVLSLYVWQKTNWSLAPLVYFIILAGLMPLALLLSRKKLIKTGP